MSWLRRVWLRLRAARDVQELLAALAGGTA
jgi:hypothetical protein